jgi:RimJ/RimL family protein N-acetyltransferase
MGNEGPLSIRLRLWTLDDAWLMNRLLGDPVMTEHLGGPESAEQLDRRLHRYVDEVGGTHGRMFVIEVGPEWQAAGSIGYWSREWRGETVWETGWHVLPERQGRGVATAATRRCVDLAEEEHLYRSIHAYPGVDNAASNATCRKAGFTLLGSVEFEYPKDHWMTCNDWAIDFHYPIRER